MIVVIDGRPVYACTIDLVKQLLDSGFDVSVVDGRVVVEPPIAEDIAEHLSTTPSDVAAAIDVYITAAMRRAFGLDQ